MAEYSLVPALLKSEIQLESCNPFKLEGCWSFFSFVLLEFGSNKEGLNTKSSTSLKRYKMNLVHHNYVSTCEEFFDDAKKRRWIKSGGKD